MRLREAEHLVEITQAGLEPSFQIQCLCQSTTATPDVKILLTATVAQLKARLLLPIQNQCVSLLINDEYQLMSYVKVRSQT